MAPERLGEHKGWQLMRSDVWAIAAITYEMFVGKRCFPGHSQREVFRNVLRGGWSWPENRKPSDSMQDFIQRCLCLDATERPTAEQALKHYWFHEVSSQKGEEKNDE